MLHKNHSFTNCKPISTEGHSITQTAATAQHNRALITGQEAAMESVNKEGTKLNAEC